SPKEVTTLSDVYGLGAVLYAWLTSRPPFQGDNMGEILKQVRDPSCQPEPPHLLNPRVDRDLEAICLRCLNKYPTRRYLSAEDLERWLDGRETQARPWGFGKRALRVCQRHAVAAALTAATVVLLLVTAVTVTSAAQEREDRLEAAHRGNSYAAYGIASNVLR